MATILDKHWPVIRQNIIARIEANGTAEVRSVTSALISNGTINDWQIGNQINSEEIQTIIAPLIASRIYSAFYKSADEVYVSKNTSYELEENIKATNLSLQTTNTSVRELNSKTDSYYIVQKNTAIAIAAFTAVTMLVGIANFLQTCGKYQQNTPPTSPNKQLLLTDTSKVHKVIDSSLTRAAKDSSSQKHR